MATASTLYKGNSSIMRLSGLRDDSGVYQNDASVQITAMVDENTGVSVGNMTFPVTMFYVVDSDGVYEGQIPYDADVEVGNHYSATIRATAATGEVAEWAEHIRVRTRRR